MASLKTTRKINIQLGSITVPESDVQAEGKKVIGNGSYGAVFTVKYRRELCAAKEIHSLLFEETVEKVNLLDVFSRECCQCSELKHPNIVTFIGVYFPNNQMLPVMLMELMDKSLRAYLDSPSDLPHTRVTLGTKSSILIDVAEGLDYLHHRIPPVIHRDLTPNNVLLKLPHDEGGVPVAKISDLGVAKAIGTNKKIKQRLTKLPGSPGFMPPEAFNENPVYNTSLDIFSYGGVVLFVANQIWPDPGAPNKNKAGKLVAFTEVQRRQQHLDKMKDGTNIWRSIAEACLSNNADERPTITDVSERLKSFKLMELELQVKELVNRLQQEGKSYNDHELERQFEDNWRQWMDSFTCDKSVLKYMYPSDSEIDEEIIRILRQQLVHHDSLIVSKLVAKSLNERSCTLHLSVNKDTHLNSIGWFARWGFGSLGNDDIKQAEHLTEQCLTSVGNYLNEIKLQLKPFTTSFACEVLKNLLKCIDNTMDTKDSGFKFTQEYKVDMAIAVCVCVSDVFKQITKKQRDNNPIFQLNEIKDVFLNMCKDLYRTVNRNTVAAKVSNASNPTENKDKDDKSYLFIILSIIIIVIAIVCFYVI